MGNPDNFALSQLGNFLLTPRADIILAILNFFLIGESKFLLYFFKWYKESPALFLFWSVRHFHFNPTSIENPTTNE